MSTLLLPFSIPSTRRKTSDLPSDLSLPPLSTWSDGHHARSPPSSSPVRSSSPPRTPPSTKTRYNYAYIQSSPGLPFDMGFDIRADHLDHQLPAWNRKITQSSTNKHQESLPSFSSVFSDPRHFSSSPSPELPEVLEDMDMGLHTFPSDYASDSAPGQSSVFASESESEGQDEDDGFSFCEQDIRSTFFRTSAERGRWRTDPMPYQTQSRLQMRQSVPAPTPSSLSSIALQAVPRTISEPAPSHPDGTFVLASEEERNITPEPLSFTSSPDDDASTHDSEFAHSLPSLSSDRSISMEADEPQSPLSPLPSSSPPLSPMSYSVSPMIGSVSPLSFALSSPLLGPSSPLLLGTRLESGTTVEAEIESEHVLSDSVPPISLEGGSPITSVPEISNTPVAIACDSVSSPLAPVESSNIGGATSGPRCEGEISDLALGVIETSTMGMTHALAGASSASHVPSETGFAAAAVSSVMSQAGEMSPGGDVNVAAVAPELVGVVGSGDVSFSAKKGVVATRVAGAKSKQSTKGKVREEEKDEEVLKIKERNGVVRSKVAGRSSKDGRDLVATREKRKTEPEPGEGPVKKKARTSSSSEAPSWSQGAKEGKRRLDDENEDSDLTVSLKAKKQKRAGGEAGVAGASQRVKPKPRARRSSQSVPESVTASSRPRPTDPETLALDAEICGMLIESMALSRASSLPASTLFKSITQTHPSLKEQKSEEEWMEVFGRVLEDGEGGRGNGMFGKVESSGKDESDRPLEAQWFYVPEQDKDQERAALIRSLMPRPAKRSVTKKYKQYYYRPLDKITRWDPEDEM